MKTAIQPIPYDPPASHRLDIEVLTMSEFRTRVAPEHLLAPQRVEFHLILFFTEGRCTHMVDFESHECTRRSVLVLRPGQVQRFDTRHASWQGWMVLFRPELLQPVVSRASREEQDLLQHIEDMPVHQVLEVNEALPVAEAMQRMARDIDARVATERRQILLRFQLLALLTRLQLTQVGGANQVAGYAMEYQRFRRFRRCVEKEFKRCHQVSAYAAQLGCSAKSLSRASLAIAGTTAKQYLLWRIALEAKRLLVHTSLSVGSISDELGFDEATNFVKFFRRESGVSPARFRESHGGQ